MFISILWYELSDFNVLNLINLSRFKEKPIFVKLENIK